MTESTDMIVEIAKSQQTKLNALGASFVQYQDQPEDATPVINLGIEDQMSSSFMSDEERIALIESP